MQGLYWRCQYKKWGREMKCLCCGKTIRENASNAEKEWSWHKKCVKSFFMTEEMPFLDITKEQLERLANETVNEGLTVPGVQKNYPCICPVTRMQDLQL